MTTKAEELIDTMYQYLEGTELYKMMMERKGKPAYFVGSFKPKILFIGEAPGREEDKEGVPFIGKAGDILHQWITENDIKQYAIMNTIPIMPTFHGQSRQPTMKEINYFRTINMNLIATLSPSYIILMGRTACKLMEETELKNTEWKRNIGFIYHPSYYLRNGQNGMSDFKMLIKKRNLGVYENEH